MLSMNLTIPRIQFRVKPVPKELKMELAEKEIAAINYRLFHEQMSGNDQLLEKNEPGWLDTKERFGFYLIPFAMTGAMTRRDAWEVIYTNSGVKIRLQDKHQEKWRNITATGKINWQYAYTLGRKEMLLLKKIVKDFLKNKLDKLVEVTNAS